MNIYIKKKINNKRIGMKKKKPAESKETGSIRKIHKEAVIIQMIRLIFCRIYTHPVYTIQYYSCCFIIYFAIIIIIIIIIAVYRYTYLLISYIIYIYNRYIYTNYTMHTEGSKGYSHRRWNDYYYRITLYCAEWPSTAKAKIVGVVSACFCPFYHHRVTTAPWPSCTITI